MFGWLADVIWLGLHTLVMYACARTAAQNAAPIKLGQAWWFVLHTSTGPTIFASRAS